MAAVDELLASVPNRLFLAAGILILGSILGLAAGRLNRRLLRRVGVPEAVDGTAFERTMRGFGTSTVSIIASLSAWFIIAMATSPRPFPRAARRPAVRRPRPIAWMARPSLSPRSATCKCSRRRSPRCSRSSS